MVRMKTKTLLATAISLVAIVLPVSANTIPQQLKTIELDGKVTSKPYGFASNGTMYMPIWYVMRALDGLGIENHWDGKHWTLKSASSMSVNLTDITLGVSQTGDSISLNGVPVERPNAIVAIDPASGRDTTYMPIWYVMQTLNRLGIHSTWNGSTWTFSTAKKTIAAWEIGGRSMTDASQYGFISEIHDDVFQINPDATVTGTPSSSQSNMVATVSNYNPSISNFDGAEVIGLLTSDSTRTTLEKNLVATANPYKGLELDFEQIPPADTAQFSSFLQELASQLHASGKTLSVIVPAETGATAESWNAGYDYSAIGQAADSVVIMAYDYSWQGSKPGPIAPLSWDKAILNYATAVMPPSKILLGIPAYGYDWDTTTQKWATANSLTTVDATIAKYHIHPSFDAKTQVPYFQYTDSTGDEHTVYYENAKSIEEKWQLVYDYNLAGVAIWRTGLENSAFRSVFE